MRWPSTALEIDNFGCQVINFHGMRTMISCFPYPQKILTMEEKTDFLEILLGNSFKSISDQFLTKSLWPNQRLMQPSAMLLQPPKPLKSSPQFHGTTLAPSSPIVKQCLKVSRRELAICTNSSLLLLLGSEALEPLQLSRARAADIIPQDNEVGQEENPKRIDFCEEREPNIRAFLDVSVDGEPIGRIVIGLYGDKAPFGSARFSNLVSGAAGISYIRKEFVKIMPSYVQHGGVRSYGVDAELARKAGSDLAADRLMDEWEKQNENCPGTKNLAKSVGIIARDPSKPPPKLKLVAREGKLEIDQEQVGTEPNGTGFVISLKDSPELDSSSLVVGRVLEGMEVVEKIGNVKTVQENTSSPYFRVAKLIGDKRAVVAERGFNRPYSKVIITNCGLMK